MKSFDVDYLFSSWKVTKVDCNVEIYSTEKKLERWGLGRWQKTAAVVSVISFSLFVLPQ